MDIAEQVAVIYSGVKGLLDKMDPSKVTAFERAFLQHLRSSQQELLDTIRKESSISPATDEKLKQLVKSFVESFTAAQ